MKPGRQKSKEEQQKENPHTLTDYMVKKFTGLRSWRMFQFFGEKVGISLEASPTSFYETARKYPGHKNPPATQAEKFTSLVIFIQLQITCCGLEQQSSDTIIGLFIYVAVQFYHLGFNFISLCFKIIIILYHTQRQRGIIFKPRTKQATSEFQKPSLSK